MQGAPYFKSVWFTVEAAHIYIMPSTADGKTTGNWEILFGGYKGLKSKIRQIGGADGAEITHTKEQFLTVCKRAPLKKKYQ